MFGTSDLLNLDTPKERALAKAIIGLLVTVFVSSLAYMADTTLTFEDMEDKLDDVVDARYLGPSNKVLHTVIDRFKGAQEIHNTFIFFGVPPRSLVATSYSKTERKDLGSGIKQFLSHGGTWKEIVSQDVVNSRELHWLQFINELKNEGESAAVERYYIRRLKEVYPVINFMILRYGDREKEVVFGWGHHPEDSEGGVFLSRNAQLVATFEAYWDILHDDSIPFDPEVPSIRPIAGADIAGLWFRVAYYLDKQNSKHPADVALVRITVDDNRRITIEGRRFDAKKGTQLNVFHSKSANLTESTLWFVSRYGFEDKLHSAGMYHFIRSAESAMPERLQGDVIVRNAPSAEIEDREAQTKTNGRDENLIVFGTRVYRTADGTLALAAFRNSDLKPFADFPEDSERENELINSWHKHWNACEGDRWVKHQFNEA